MTNEIALLKDMIDENGIGFISRMPFETYERLMHAGADPRNARMILSTLLSKTADKASTLNQQELSADIQKECCMRTDAADQMAELYKTLFSEANLKEWSAKAGAGLREFGCRDWNFQWDCTREYHNGDGYADCTCSVEAEFSVKDQMMLKNAIRRELDENPFLSSSQIESILSSDLAARLDHDVSDYVNSDDYYEPWMPDYDCSDVMNHFCEQYGLEVIECSCNGDTSDWQRDW